jgi:hypothetical protein
MRTLPLTIALLGLSLAACDDAESTQAQQITDAAQADVGPDSDAGPESDAGPDADAGVEPDAAPEPTATFSTRAGVERIALWNAPTETTFEVLDDADAVVRTGVTDGLGSVLFREMEAGTYTVRNADAPDDHQPDLVVMTPEDSLPDPSFYNDQVLEPGFGYLTTRDGTKLSIFVSLPGPIEDGPYPTLVNYSGYSPSQPGEPLGGPADALCNLYPVLCNAPSFPTGIIGTVMGFATVGVNVRGTGCSAGAYDYFDKPQILDGYDAIEIVAAQPWVKHNKVGMTGLSFPGITQLFVAAAQPPSLAAIAPMSVIADTASSTLVPGGIYNNGFALAWIDNVLDKAAPYAHGWINEVIEAGDPLCDEHQLLHGQRLDATAKALANPYYSDEVALPIDPSQFVHQIEVPVFLTGQWQDEQTGPHFAVLGSKFTNAPFFRMIATNGVHIDGLAPQVLRDWFDFLSIYVAQEVPQLDPVLESIVPTFMGTIFGGPIELPADAFADYTPDDYDAAKAAYEAQDSIRITFESGANPDTEPALPQGTFHHTFAAWPIPSTQATRWYLQADGSLADAAPDAAEAASTFEHDPEAGQRGSLAGGGVNRLPINWDYRPLRPGHALAFIGEPLEDDVVMIGHGSVDLWLRSTATDADLEVSLTEVRADGQETLVQGGFLRASHRALRDDATVLRPVKSHYEADIVPLVANEWTEARVEIMPFAHIFRAGSRVRISVDTPGDTTADWKFLLTEYDGPVWHTIGHDIAHPSSVVLPVVPNLDVPSEPSDCTALRGQPCRAYTPHENPPAVPEEG